MSIVPSCLHILVVDDEEDMCWALQRIIETEGHRTTAAKSAQEALRVLAAQKIDLAFVDGKMPDMEGLELVRHLRARSPALLCVLISGYYNLDDEPVQDELDAGWICGFLGKPFLLNQVRDAIQFGTQVN